MTDRKFTSGKTLEKRLDSAERTFQHFQRRLSKSVGFMIPPSPVSDYCETPDEKGIILRYMFPARGKVESGAVKIDNFPQDQKRVGLVADIYTVEDAMQKEFEVRNIVNVFTLNMDVDAGARFELRLKDPKIEAKKIWVAFLYQVEPSKARLHTELVEKLEELGKFDAGI